MGAIVLVCLMWIVIIAVAITLAPYILGILGWAIGAAVILGLLGLIMSYINMPATNPSSKTLGITYKPWNYVTAQEEFERRELNRRSARNEWTARPTQRVTAPVSNQPPNNPHKDVPTHGGLTL